MIKKRGSIAHHEFLTNLKGAVSNGATFTDTHAHIHFSPLLDELPEVISRAADNGVNRIVTIGIDLADSKKAKAVSDKYENVFFSVGVHPHDSSNFTLAQLSEFDKLLADPKAIAIGEIGLDYFRDHSPHDKQKEVFLTFLDMAITHNKPVVIHNRDAGKDCIEVMDSMIKGRENNGIIHCYDGDRDVLRWALDKGFYISYAGPLTYSKTDDLKDTLKYVPIDRIFIETDCPYLTPTPFRGKTNEPANVVYTANQICHLINCNLTELAVQLENNYTRLFRL
ncbi:MAG: TatD family deoxyribonuclease [Denitrovibrio sp.]|nr:MAG: TatD family deoxyribonuclease [Denitrovibrio sp.]